MFCAGCCGVSTLGATNVCWCVSFSFFSGGAIDARARTKEAASIERGARSRKSKLRKQLKGSVRKFHRPPPSSVQCTVPCGSNARKTSFSTASHAIKCELT